MIAGIEDRHRGFVVDGDPVATGVVAVGDAWACTNPSLGRGATIGLLHAVRAARRAARHRHRTITTSWYAGSTSGPPPRWSRCTAPPCGSTGTGWPNSTPTPPACRTGTDDPRWAFSLAMFAAGRADPDVARAYLSLTSLLATPDELLAEPGLAEKITKLGGHAPNYPLPGPTRRPARRHRHLNTTTTRHLEAAMTIDLRHRTARMITAGRHAGRGVPSGRAARRRRQGR